MLAYESGLVRAGDGGTRRRLNPARQAPVGTGVGSPPWNSALLGRSDLPRREMPEEDPGERDRQPPLERPEEDDAGADRR